MSLWVIILVVVAIAITLIAGMVSEIRELRGGD